MQVLSKVHTVDTLNAAIERASALYGGNLTAEVEHKAGNRYRVKIGARDSRGDGARRSASGRRGPWACWHAFRDVVRAIMAVDKDTRVTTSLARYVGSDGFEDTYPATAYTNVGSMIYPATMPDLCDCH